MICNNNTYNYTNDYSFYTNDVPYGYYDEPGVGELKGFF